MKKFLRATLATLLVGSLIAFVAAISINRLFQNPDNVKGSLESSSLYENMPDLLVDSALREEEETQQPSIPKDEVRQAARQAFPAEVVRQGMENFIDGTYNWANGESEQPDFRIDLSEPLHNFANALADQVAGRIQNSPPCTLEQLRELQTMPQDEALLSLKCRPPNFDFEQTRLQILAFIEQELGLSENTVITADTLPKDEQGRTFFERLSAAPAVLQQAQRLPLLFGLLGLLFAGGILLLSSPRLRGLRTVGLIFAVTGTLLGIIHIFARIFAEKAAKQAVETESPTAGAIAGEAVSSLASIYASNVIMFSAILLAAGLVFLLISHGLAAVPGKR